MSFEAFVRGFVSMDSRPAPRPVAEPPAHVVPPAFIRWGAPSDWDDFRTEASKPGGFGIVEDYIPLQGNYTEEARVRGELTVTNPDDNSQHVTIPTLTEVAFTAPGREQKNPLPYRADVTMYDQVVFRFGSQFDDIFPDYLLAASGEQFEPVVISPFQSIMDVGWSSEEFFLIYLLFENTKPDVWLDLAYPSNKNINSRGGIGKDVHGNDINASDPIMDDNGRPVLDDAGNQKFYVGDESNTPLFELFSGDGEEDPDGSNGTYQHYDEKGNEQSDVPIVFEFGPGFPPYEYYQIGSGVYWIEPQWDGDPDPPNPAVKRFFDTWKIGGYGQDGPSVVFDDNGESEEWGGGSLRPGDSHPAQMVLVRNRPIKIIQHYNDIDTNEVVTLEHIITDGVFEDPPWGYGGGGSKPVYFYHEITPEYSIFVPNIFKWWIGCINAALLWKMFRTDYSKPAAMEVNIYAVASEDGEEKKGPKTTRARWSWHKGHDALEEIRAWDGELYESPPGEGGSG